MNLTREIVAKLPTTPSNKPKGWELLRPVKWEYIINRRVLLVVAVETGWDRIVGKLIHHASPNTEGLYGWQSKSKEGYSLMYSRDSSTPDKRIKLSVMAQYLVDHYYRTTLQLIDTDKL